jgi:hypothetical protein
MVRGLFTGPASHYRDARRCLEKAINLNDVPEKITTDKSVACVDSADTSMQIPQQHHRSGPSSHQTNLPGDTRIQGVFACMHHHRRNRNRAHDPQGEEVLSRRQNHVCSPCNLIPNAATHSFWPDTAIATEPKNLMKHCWRICRFLKLM